MKKTQAVTAVKPGLFRMKVLMKLITFANRIKRNRKMIGVTQIADTVMV